MVFPTSGSSQYASKYQEDVYRVDWIIRDVYGFKLPFDQLDAALIRVGGRVHDVYVDLSRGEETPRVTALTEYLGLPQYSLSSRHGVKIEGKIIDADESFIGALPEGQQ